jgi:predicted dehydrogenase
MVAAEAAHGGLLMEAQHSHYHPLSAFMRALVHSGDLGSIVQVDATFCAPVPATPGELRYDHGVGGGALWDLGVYPAYWARSALGETVTVEHAQARYTNNDPLSGADIGTTAALRSARGTAISIACAMDQPLRAHIRFTGDKGWLDIRNPLAPQMGHDCRWAVNCTEYARQFDAPSTYALQLAAFRDAVQNGAPVPTRGADTLATMRLISAIDANARQEASHAD